MSIVHLTEQKEPIMDLGEKYDAALTGVIAVLWLAFTALVVCF